jgi:hypothetical protein
MQTAICSPQRVALAFAPDGNGSPQFSPDCRSFPSLRPLWRHLQCSRGYDVSPVRSADQQDVVSSLVRRRYAWRGYKTEALGQRADDPNRLTLAAWQYDELAATLTLARDSPEGLQTDGLYASELAGLRHPDRVLCEVTRLAVDPDFSCPELLRTLFASALHYGKGLFAASDVVIGVNPRHAAYYQRLMGFRQIGRLRHCRRVDAPVILLHRVLSDISFVGAV